MSGLDGGGPVGGRDAGGGAVRGSRRVGERGALRLGVVVATISGMSSSSSRSPVIGAQMTPEVWRTKKAIFSGVAASAAMMRSPSFSRSSSSTTTTISPRGDGGDGVLDRARTGVLGRARCGVTGSARCVRSGTGSRSAPARRRSTYLAMTSTSRLTGSPGPLRPRVVTAAVCGMTATVKPSSSGVDDGEADAVDGDRALLDDVAQQLGRHADLQVGRRVDDLADGVDVALHEVAAEAVLEADRPLEVDRVARRQVAEVGAGEGLVGDVGLPPARRRSRRRR